MIFILRHIEFVRGKPDHVRKQVALGIAALLTAVIALVWLGASLATGAFAVKGSSFADVAKVALPVKQSTGGERLVGAAAAVFGTSAEPAHIEIVDTNVHSTLTEKSGEEPTIIPF